MTELELVGRAVADLADSPGPLIDPGTLLSRELVAEWQKQRGRFRVRSEQLKVKAAGQLVMTDMGSQISRAASPTLFTILGT